MTSDEDVNAAVQALLNEGQALLTGPASVQLVIAVEDAATPEEAVELVIRRIAHVGLDAFTFAVTDKLSGEHYLVQAGKLFSLDEVEDAIQQSGARDQDEDARA